MLELLWQIPLKSPSDTVILRRKPKNLDSYNSECVRSFVSLRMTDQVAQYG